MPHDLTFKWTLVAILPTHVIHALDTGHLLRLYHLKL